MTTTRKRNESDAERSEFQRRQGKAWKEEKVFELAASDPDLAEAWAAQNNVPVPAHMSQIIRNRKAMGAITSLMKALKDQYSGDHNADYRSQEFKRILSAIVTQGGGVDQGAIPGRTGVTRGAGCTPDAAIRPGNR